MTIRVRATDNVRVESLALRVGGRPVALDAGGSARVTLGEQGLVDVAATATDAAGNVGRATAEVRVLAPDDAREPTVVILSPDPATVTEVTYLTQIRGTIRVPDGQRLDYYVVEVARADLVDEARIGADNPAFREIGRGREPVEDGVLATFDPTTLENDGYIIRVKAFNTNGIGRAAGARVVVAGEAKLGRLRLEFDDLTVPVAGIPIAITRVYDSFAAARSGDFGFGWTLGVRDAQVRETVPQSGGDGFFTTAAPFRTGTKVYLTNPEGRRVGFTFEPSFTPRGLVASFTPRFRPDPGVTDTLTVDDFPLGQRPDGTWGLAVFGLGYNPDVYTLTTRDGVAYRYNQATGLERVADRNGNTLTFTDEGIVSSAGESVRFERDNLRRITRIVDPAGNALTYRYDVRGDLVEARDQERTGRGETGTTFTYKARPEHYLDTIVDPDGRLVVRADYDEHGRLEATTDGAGRATTAVFDPGRFTETILDGRGNPTVLTYDARGNVVARRDAEGNTTLYEYGDPANPDRETRVIDPRGNPTTFTYDARGNVMSVTDAAGNTTTTTYNAADQVTSTTDALGRTVTSIYDDRGNLAQVVDAAGSSRTATYDDRGRVRSVTDALGHTTTFEYEAGCACGSPEVIIHPDGTRRTLAYNHFGQVTRVVDEKGNETVYTYDNVGLLRSTLDAEGHEAVFDYDGTGNRTLVRDPLGNETRFVYDAAGRLEVETDPLGHETIYAYDAAGNLRRRTDRNERVREFEYDRANRLTFERWYDPDGTLVRTIATTYDPAGNRLTASDPDSSLVFTYDALNRVETASNAGTPGVPTVVLTYRHDAAGNVLSVTDNLGVRVDSTYDRRDLLARRTWRGPGVDPARVDFDYDAQGRRIGVLRFADLAGTRRVGRTTLAYDDLGRVDRLTHTGAVDAVLADYDYDYDPVGLLEAESHLGQTAAYRYDRTGQLLAADRSTLPDETYHYDANGNRDYGGYVVGPNNRIETDGTFNYGYDDEGNMIRKTAIATGAVTAYAYDHRNRLVLVEERDARGALLGEVRFVYDALGRRIGKVVGDNAVHTVYNGGNAWADMDAGGGVVARYLFGDQIDELIARQRTGEGTVWYLTDWLGTVHDLADALGNPVNHVEYDSFGNVVVQTSPSAGDRYLFTGREFDSEAGLYYHRARYHNPTLARFISPDPTGFEGGDFNLYRFVGNSPAYRTDPTGEVAVVVFLVGLSFSTAIAANTFARTGSVPAAICAGIAYPALFLQPPPSPFGVIVLLACYWGNI